MNGHAYARIGVRRCKTSKADTLSSSNGDRCRDLISFVPANMSMIMLYYLTSLSTISCFYPCA